MQYSLYSATLVLKLIGGRHILVNKRKGILISIKAKLTENHGSIWTMLAQTIAIQAVPVNKEFWEAPVKLAHSDVLISI
jgi:hypothetical protein